MHRSTLSVRTVAQRNRTVSADALRAGPDLGHMVPCKVPCRWWRPNREPPLCVAPSAGHPGSRIKSRNQKQVTVQHLQACVCV